MVIPCWIQRHSNSACLHDWRTCIGARCSALCVSGWVVVLGSPIPRLCVFCSAQLLWWCCPLLVQCNFPSGRSLDVAFTGGHHVLSWEWQVSAVCGRAVGSVTEVTSFCTGIIGILYPQVLRRSEQAGLKFLLKFRIGIGTGCYRHFIRAYLWPLLKLLLSYHNREFLGLTMTHAGSFDLFSPSQVVQGPCWKPEVWNVAL